ncbi:nucleotidyltransferase family protein [Nodosilinea sp. PGN35]|uniref:nucleotidyltransferase family protein n=1 Tax=Nodosilinea sp. PGN35 TaxID=3020489 RepID=UPI0023B2B5B1|nr:nucleotidyltransferase domain-containing protein [Nodosilinea sp. TSF1-S3]MDF0366886.1 nucleotidyltransferase domain-containing protein [Nodosilinea sp. TSF1-S3]
MASPPSCNDVLTLVKAHQATLETMGVKSLDLFGSVARNQANPASDIDFLIEFSQPVGLFQLLEIQYFLEDLLEHSIELGTADFLKEHLREPVLEDAIRVF